MKPLIENGNLYIAMPPLYKITMGSKEHYVWTNEEIRELIKGKSNYKIKRYKG
jgi:DNA gyrase/topoisomerase IV subunit B